MVKFYKVFFSLLLVTAFSVASQTASAQTVGFAPGKGYKQVNFGIELEGRGLPFYVGMDFGVGEFITVGPRLIVETEGESLDAGGMELHSRATAFVPSFRGDYHFSGHIKGLPAELDLYGGLTFGLVIVNASSEYIDLEGEKQRNSNTSDPDARLWAQAGGRYFFNENWGVQLELTTLGGNGDAALGLSYRF
jgi:outer membrane immunogenic protein